MRISYVFSVLFCLIFGSSLLAQQPAKEKEAEAAVLSDEALEAYYASLREEIAKQDGQVQALVKRSQSGQQVPSQIQRVEFEQAAVMLDVKSTLYTNFYNTDSIKQSKAVRDLLQKILSQPDISVADLAALQNLVKQEKERLGIE